VRPPPAATRGLLPANAGPTAYGAPESGLPHLSGIHRAARTATEAGENVIVAHEQLSGAAFVRLSELDDRALERVLSLDSPEAFTTARKSIAGLLAPYESGPAWKAGAAARGHGFPSAQIQVGAFPTAMRAANRAVKAAKKAAKPPSARAIHAANLKADRAKLRAERGQYRARQVGNPHLPPPDISREAATNEAMLYAGRYGMTMAIEQKGPGKAWVEIERWAPKSKHSQQAVKVASPGATNYEKTDAKLARNLREGARERANEAVQAKHERDRW